VLNGDKVTGVTVQQVAYEVDSGDVLASMETEIGEFETSGQLFERLKELGAGLLARTIRGIENGTAVPMPQDASAVSVTTKLDKCMSPIDWNRSPREIVKWICGLDPWPVATMQYGGEVLRVFGAAYTERHTVKAPGSIVSAGRKRAGNSLRRGPDLACHGTAGTGRPADERGGISARASPGAAMSGASNARQAALFALGRCRRDGAWSPQALSAAAAKYKLDRRDTALSARLCRTVLQNASLCDFYIDSYSSMKSGRLEPQLRDILRLGICQLVLMDRIRKARPSASPWSSRKAPDSAEPRGW
jgi:transcription termination factor NusB